MFSFLVFLLARTDVNTLTISPSYPIMPLLLSAIFIPFSKNPLSSSPHSSSSFMFFLTSAAFGERGPAAVGKSGERKQQEMRNDLSGYFRSFLKCHPCGMQSRAAQRPGWAPHPPTKPKLLHTHRLPLMSELLQFFPFPPPLGDDPDTKRKHPLITALTLPPSPLRVDQINLACGQPSRHLLVSSWSASPQCGDNKLQSSFLIIRITSEFMQLKRNKLQMSILP